jgi:MoxR-like ATPase
LAAQGRALLAGQTHVTPEHIREVAMPVLRHRVLTNFNAEADQVRTDDIIAGLLGAVPVEASGARETAQMNEAMRQG